MFEKTLTWVSWIALYLGAFLGFVDAFCLVFNVNPQTGWVWLVAFASALCVWSLYSFTVQPLRHALSVQQVWCPGCGNKHEPPLCEVD